MSDYLSDLPAEERLKQELLQMATEYHEKGGSRREFGQDEVKNFIPKTIEFDYIVPVIKTRIPISIDVNHVDLTINDGSLNASISVSALKKTGRMEVTMENVPPDRVMDEEIEATRILMNPQEVRLGPKKINLQQILTTKYGGTMAASLLKTELAKKLGKDDNAFDETEIKLVLKDDKLIVSLGDDEEEDVEKQLSKKVSFAKVEQPEGDSSELDKLLMSLHGGYEYVELLNMWDDETKRQRLDPFELAPQYMKEAHDLLNSRMEENVHQMSPHNLEIRNRQEMILYIFGQTVAEDMKKYFGHVPGDTGKERDLYNKKQAELALFAIRFYSRKEDEDKLSAEFFKWAGEAKNLLAIK